MIRSNLGNFDRVVAQSGVAFAVSAMVIFLNATYSLKVKPCFLMRSQLSEKFGTPKRDILNWAENSFFCLVDHYTFFEKSSLLWGEREFESNCK